MQTILYLDKWNPALADPVAVPELKKTPIYTLKSAKSGLIAFSNDKSLIDLLKDDVKGHQYLYTLNRLLESKGYFDIDYTVTELNDPVVAIRLLGAIDYIGSDFISVEVYGRSVDLYDDWIKFIDNFKLDNIDDRYVVMETENPISPLPKNVAYEWDFLHIDPDKEQHIYIIDRFATINGCAEIDNATAEHIIRKYIIDNYGEAVFEESYKNCFGIINDRKREVVILLRELCSNEEDIHLGMLNSNDEEFKAILHNITVNNIDNMCCGFIRVEDTKCFYLIHEEEAEYLKTRIQLAPLLDLDKIIATLVNWYRQDINCLEDELVIRVQKLN